MNNKPTKNISIHSTIPKSKGVIIVNHNDNKKYHLTKKNVDIFKAWDIYDLFFNSPNPTWKEMKDGQQYNEDSNVTYLPPDDILCDGISTDNNLKMMLDFCKFCKSRPVYIYGREGHESSQFKVCEIHAKEFDV